jgi:chemotaxis protein CheX
LINSQRPLLDALGASLASKGLLTVSVDSVRDVKAQIESERFSAVLLEARLEKEKAIKLLAYIRRSISRQALLFVNHAYLATPILDKLESAGAVRRLIHGFADTAGVVREVCDVLVPKKKPFYDVNVINCIVQSVIDVLEYYSGELPMLDAMKVKDGRAAIAGYATGLSRLTGPHARGSISLSCDKGFITRMAARIAGLGSARNAQIGDKVIAAATHDLCDQIFGKAGVLLATLGWEFDVTLPSVHIGEEHTVDHFGDAPVMMIPFRLGKTKFCVEFCLEEA